MKVMKRNGTEVIFDITKIIAAITKANNTIEEDARMTPVQIQRIAESVELSCQKMNRSPSVEEIQDLVESQIMAHGAYEVAKNYITYRYVRSLVRKSNTTDEKILSLIECCNEEAKQENSNKNPVVNSTQRDYMAEAERHGGHLRHHEDHRRHHQGQQHYRGGRPDDPGPDPADRGVRGTQLSEDEPLPLCGGDSGPGGVPDHGSRGL